MYMWQTRTTIPFERSRLAGAASTLAGSATNSGSADGAGSNARFYCPNGITVDSAGNVYVADSNNATIRKVTPWGAVTTIAGHAGYGGSTDGTGNVARFYYPLDVAVNNEGNLYAPDYLSATIRKVTPVGTNWVVGTIAGLAGTNFGDFGQIGSSDGRAAPLGLISLRVLHRIAQEASM